MERVRARDRAGERESERETGQGMEARVHHYVEGGKIRYHRVSSIDVLTNLNTLRNMQGKEGIT